MENQNSTKKSVDSYMYKKSSKSNADKVISISNNMQDVEIQEEDLNNINKKIDDELILITEEDERKIKEIASDINEKAFYGKIIQNKKNII